MPNLAFLALKVRQPLRHLLLLLTLGFCFGSLESPAGAQGKKEPKDEPFVQPAHPDPPAKVEVKPEARDSEIRERLAKMARTSARKPCCRARSKS